MVGLAHSDVRSNASQSRQTQARRWFRPHRTVRMHSHRAHVPVKSTNRSKRHHQDPGLPVAEADSPRPHKQHRYSTSTDPVFSPVQTPQPPQNSPGPPKFTNVQIGSNPNWDAPLGSTVLNALTLEILRIHHPYLGKVDENIRRNQATPTRCFHSQVRSDGRIGTWSNQGGRCDSCMLSGRQCFYFTDRETIRVMGE